MGIGKNTNKQKSFSILHHSKVVTNDDKISELFNEYFTNVGNNLASGIYP